MLTTRAIVLVLTTRCPMDVGAVDGVLIRVQEALLHSAMRAMFQMRWSPIIERASK